MKKQNIDKTTIITPNDFYGNCFYNPGDLSQFICPEDKNTNPFASARKYSPGDGTVIYFPSGIQKKSIRTILGIYDFSSRTDYVLFLQESKDPLIDGYLSQMRLLCRSALRYPFKVIDDIGLETFKMQTIPAYEALWKFIEQEKQKYETHEGKKALKGKFGGDSDIAKEVLSFGFMVESDDYKVFRIWSRAWLEHK